jgi:hypothetical protein
MKQRYLYSFPELALLGLLDFATDRQLQDLASLAEISEPLRRQICAAAARRARDPQYWEMYDHAHLSHEVTGDNFEGLTPERRMWLRAELARGDYRERLREQATQREEAQRTGGANHE